MHDLPANIPPRLYTKDVCLLVGVGPRKWSDLRKKGIAPDPLTRGKGGDIYKGIDIARFLGLVDERVKNVEDDPFMKGLQSLGRAKR